MLRQAGIFIMPVFKNGKVLRITVPRLVARMLSLSAGDYVTIQHNAAGELVLRKFNVEKLRDEYIQGRSSQLDLGAGRTTPPRD